MGYNKDPISETRLSLESNWISPEESTVILKLNKTWIMMLGEKTKETSIKNMFIFLLGIHSVITPMSLHNPEEK